MIQIIGAKVDDIILLESAHDPLLRSRVDLSKTQSSNSLDGIVLDYNKLFND